MTTDPGAGRPLKPGAVYWAPSGTDPDDPDAWVYLGDIAGQVPAFLDVPLLTLDRAPCGECGSVPCASTCPAQDDD
jgi:hypothetical protein